MTEDSSRDCGAPWSFFSPWGCVKEVMVTKPMKPLWPFTCQHFHKFRILPEVSWNHSIRWRRKFLSLELSHAAANPRKAAEARQNDMERKVAQKDLDREKMLGINCWRVIVVELVHHHPNMTFDVQYTPQNGINDEML